MKKINKKKIIKNILINVLKNHIVFFTKIDLEIEY